MTNICGLVANAWTLWLRHHLAGSGPAASDGCVGLRGGGDLTVKIAKTRTGSFFATLLTPRRRIDVALYAVVMEAYVHSLHPQGR